MLKLKTEMTLPAVGLTGFETPLSEEESAIQHSVHLFAKNVLRPIGRELDKMSPEEVIAPDSPFWTVFQEAAKMGLDPTFFSQFEPQTAIRLESMIAEELGWGDAGLAASLGVSNFPLVMAHATGKQELIDLCTGKIGCWVITQPDRGSDAVCLYEEELPAGAATSKGNVTARINGDEIVINGQSSAWVSNGPVAQVALCYIAADYGDGCMGADGLAHGTAVIVPLDLPGVTRGKPLHKMGQRALPQGEIYFDNVRVPIRYAAALKDDYYGNLNSTWSYAGSHMCQIFTGAARAAFELALAYAHERKQGGTLLVNHSLTRWRLGDMLRRVEMARAIARRSLAYAHLSPQTHGYATAQAKVSVTEEAMKVVHEALQMFGGNGVTCEYPIEKIFRDTRAALIEDGENYVLTMRLGVLASRLYQEGWTQN